MQINQLDTPNGQTCRAPAFDVISAEDGDQRTPRESLHRISVPIYK